MKKILVACGNGMGTSMLIKNLVQRVFDGLSIEVTVEHESIGEALSCARNYDIVIVPSLFESQFTNLGETVLISLQNLMSADELLSKLKEKNIV